MKHGESSESGFGQEGESSLVSYFEGLPKLNSILVRVGTPDEHDLMWLERGLKTWPGGYDLAKVLDEVRVELLQLWRFDDGVVLTQIIQKPSLRELCIMTVAGKGYLKKIDQITSELTRLARERGCQILGAEASSRAMMRVCKKMGAIPMSIYMVKGILDG